MTAADPDRALVYEAEGAVERLFDRRAEFPVVEMFGSTVTVPEDRKFGDVAAVQRYVDAVLALDWVRDLAPGRAGLGVRVRARRGASRAEYEVSTRTIAIPTHRVGGRWAMRELVVLHEIAHHLTAAVGHGREFVRMFVALVEELVGPEAGFLLRAQFNAVAAGAGRPGTR